MREGEGFCARDESGSAQLPFGEIVRVDAGESPVEGGSGVNVFGADGGGESAAFFDG